MKRQKELALSVYKYSLTTSYLETHLFYTEMPFYRYHTWSFVTEDMTYATINRVLLLEQESIYLLDQLMKSFKNRIIFYKPEEDIFQKYRVLVYTKLSN